MRVVRVGSTLALEEIEEVEEKEDKDVEKEKTEAIRNGFLLFALSPSDCRTEGGARGLGSEGQQGADGS